jgi:hypothetical protein
MEATAPSKKLICFDVIANDECYTRRRGFLLHRSAGSTETAEPMRRGSDFALTTTPRCKHTKPMTPLLPLSRAYFEYLYREGLETPI